MGEAVAFYIGAKSEILSLHRAQQAWKAAKPFWSAMPIARIDARACEDYRAARKHCKAVTVRNELAVIRAAVNMAEREKLIHKAPFIKMPQLPRAAVRHLTKAQFRKLIAGASAPHVRLFMELAVATGARMTALLELTWNRTDLDARRIDLNPAGRVQTSKGRPTVPINDQLLASLTAAREAAATDYVIEHGGRRVGSIKTGWNAAVKRAGVRATPHMLRHSAAVWLAEAGHPMAVIGQYLGHTDSRITEKVYARYSPDFLRSVAADLQW